MIGIAQASPGDRHQVFCAPSRVGLDQELANFLHWPSVNVMVQSGARIYGKRVLGVILTGMG